MTKYITIDLLWTLYCAFLERDFPDAAKPDKKQFMGKVTDILDSYLIADGK